MLIFKDIVGPSTMLEVEEDFVTGALKVSQLVNMKTNKLSTHSESENHVIEKTHTKQKELIHQWWLGECEQWTLQTNGTCIYQRRRQAGSLSKGRKDEHKSRF